MRSLSLVMVAAIRAQQQKRVEMIELNLCLVSCHQFLEYIVPLYYSNIIIIGVISISGRYCRTKRY